MITYIRKNIKGYYIEFPEEIDAQYWEGKIGTTYEDFINNKWIRLSDEQVAFHKEHPKANIDQVLSMTLPEPHVKTLEEAKMEKIHQIENYDKSDSVNSFTVVLGEDNSIEHWLTPD